jgi:hypothetical protein
VVEVPDKLLQQIFARVLASLTAEARVRALTGRVCLRCSSTVEDEDDLGQVSPLYVIYLLTEKTMALLSIGFLLCKLR